MRKSPLVERMGWTAAVEQDSPRLSQPVATIPPEWIDQMRESSKSAACHFDLMLSAGCSSGAYLPLTFAQFWSAEKPSAITLTTGLTRVGSFLDGSGNGRFVAARRTDRNETIVITVYEPDPELWEPGFRKRRKS